MEVEGVASCCVVEEQAVFKLKLSRLVDILDQTRLIFPPLKRLVFEVFWFLLAVIEIVRFLQNLL